MRIRWTDTDGYVGARIELIGMLSVDVYREGGRNNREGYVEQIDVNNGLGGACLGQAVIDDQNGWAKCFFIRFMRFVWSDVERAIRNVNVSDIWLISGSTYRQINDCEKCNDPCRY